MSDDGFSALASKHSVDEETRGQRGSMVVLVDGKEGPIVERGEGLDEELSAVGWSLRSPGQVGLARDGSGRYHVLRSKEVDIAARTFSEGLAPQVKGVAELERRDQALRRAEKNFVRRPTLPSMRPPCTVSRSPPGRLAVARSGRHPPGFRKS